MKSVELFAGAGGLGMGISLAGFEPSVVIEWDRWACNTIRENSRRGYPLVKNWPVFEGDVREFNYGSLEDKVDLVAGGPPCQPFSMGGNHKGKDDYRDMFPTTVGVIQRLRPRAFIIENVRGLTRPSFINYFQYVILQLTYPEVLRRTEENWIDHLGRLEREKTSGRRRGLMYDVVYRVLNATDYGVPQRRDRVFIVGFRMDLGIRWSFPKPTHSFDSLLAEQWVTGRYWERHELEKTRYRSPPENFHRRIQKIKASDDLPTLALRPWRTVRDALIDIPEPSGNENFDQFFDHKLQLGARQYPGHTGSPLDLPAKALKAGDHGVPGGENMLVSDDGTVRYFTVREAARLQCFPDNYVFHGAWSEVMRQLGNAVPVKLAHVVASSVATKLLQQEENQFRKLIIRLARE